MIDSINNKNEQDIVTTNEYFMSNTAPNNKDEFTPKDGYVKEQINSMTNKDLNHIKPIETNDQYYISGTMTPTLLKDMKSIDTISDAMSLDDQIREKLQEVRNEKIFSNT